MAGATPEYAWVDIKKGDDVNSDSDYVAVLAAVHGDGNVYVGRHENTEVGKLQTDKDGAMSNISCHRADPTGWYGSESKGQILTVAKGATAQWLKVSRGGTLPKYAVVGGSTEQDGTMYPCRLDGAVGKLTIEDTGRIANMWFHGTMSAYAEAEVLCISPVGAGNVWYGFEGKAHRNNLGGLIANTSGDAFITYEMAIPSEIIARHFQEQYQDNYDEEHMKIFADDVEGHAIRAGITAEHNLLYREGILPDWMHSEGPRTQTFRLESGNDFIKVLKGGIRNDTARVYTYALVDNGLFFSETGAGFSKDTLSKHAVHANANPKVRYSGTFRICFKGEQPVVVLDNDSGTYRPCTEDGARAKAALEESFPGLEVCALSVLVEQPEDTKSWKGPDENKTSDQQVYPGQWQWQPVN